MRKNLVFLGILLLTFHSLMAQERIDILHQNPLLLNYRAEISFKKAALSLPFADDFNSTSFYPDPNLWEDNFVFVNNNIPVSPPTKGVATFDGLNPLGKPYSDNVNSFGVSDQLTSMPIDLSVYQESDNIYLSFYWQAGGLGDLPDPATDYLEVQFLNNQQEWITLKKIIPPDTVNPFHQEFIQVLSDFFHADFQFRFVAYGNLSGNTDNWNIDYVLLDRNRNPEFESSVSDVAYTRGNVGYFKNYYQMPFKHFLPEYLKDTISVNVKNNFLNTVDIVDNYTVTNLNNSQILTQYNGPSIDIVSLESMDFSYPALDLSSVQAADTIEIEVHYYFETSAENTSPQFVKDNNELREKITFANLFAYDDGSAERAYRLENFDFGKIAVQFHATVPDTLRALRIHFPYFPNFSSNISEPFFNVVVYKSLDTANGEEDDVLYRENLVQKSAFHVPDGEIFNGFAYYTFNPELNNGQEYILVDGDFYIGIEYEKNNEVDLGFDLNQVNSNYMWYDVGYGWYRSQFPGSIMINAVMGKPLDGKYTSVFNSVTENKSIYLYPNPTNDIVKISSQIPENLFYDIYSISGAKIASGRMNSDQTFSVNHLPQGVYILQLKDKNEKWVGYSKFIKQ